MQIRKITIKNNIRYFSVEENLKLGGKYPKIKFGHNTKENGKTPRRV